MAKSVVVYHIPKRAEGVDVQGWEGTVVKDVTEYKGKTLSANLPYKVQFSMEKEGSSKPLKVFIHLVRWVGGGAYTPRGRPLRSDITDIWTLPCVNTPGSGPEHHAFAFATRRTLFVVR